MSFKDFTRFSVSPSLNDSSLVTLSLIDLISLSIILPIAIIFSSSTVAIIFFWSREIAVISCLIWPISSTLLAVTLVISVIREFISRNRRNAMAKIAIIRPIKMEKAVISFFRILNVKFMELVIGVLLF